MKKYNWAMIKTLEFLNSRRPDLEIRVTFIRQLGEYEQRLGMRAKAPMTVAWQDLTEENKFLESEELLLSNTFMNAKQGQRVDLDDANQKHYVPRLRWVDHESRGRKKLAVEDKDENDLINIANPKRVINHIIKKPSSLKSAIKVPRDKK